MSRKRKKLKRLTSGFLSAAMAVTMVPMVPIPAMASQTTQKSNVAIDNPAYTRETVETVNTLYINTDLTKEEAYKKLKALIQEVKEEKEKTDIYTEKNIAELEKKLKEAEKWLEDEGDPAVTASHIATAVYKLETAFEAFKATAEQRPETPEGVVLIDENFDNPSEGNFGFSEGASIVDGVLHLTEGMTSNNKKVVKTFAPEVAASSKIDLSFDWSSNIPKKKGKTGIEFRDSYGRVLFALCGCYNESKKQYELRYAVEGTASDSSVVIDPTWVAATLVPGQIYKVHVAADFDKGMLNFEITDPTGAIVHSKKEVTTTASALSQMMACNYWTIDSGNTVYPAVQSVDNFKLYGTQEDLPLLGKTMYAFGDSVVYGHKYSKFSFPNYVAEKEGLYFTNENKYAKNGASIVKNDSNWILTQIQNAPDKAPDYVLFDGGINNAYEDTVLGTISDSKDIASFDDTTFAGAFEKTIATIYEKWPNTNIVYTAIHKTNSREAEIQQKLYELEMQICEKWDVTVADIYSQDEIDCLNNKENLAKYAFDNLSSKTGLPVSNSKSATHPNLLAIEEFYVPTVVQALRDAGKSETEENTDKKALSAMIQMVEKLNSEDFSTVTWNNLTEKLEVAKKLEADSGASQAAVDEAYIELVRAFHALESGLNTVAAEQFIIQAETILEEAQNDPNKYRPADIQAITDALEPVKAAVEAGTVTQEELNTLAMELLDKLNNLRDQVEADVLETMISLVEQILENKDKYTSDSIKDLETALQEAKEVVENGDRTQEQIGNAYENLNTAIAGLEIRGNKDVLKPLLEKAEEIQKNSSKYESTSLDGLEEAAKAAQLVYDNPDALQKEINEAATKLAEQLAQVRIVGDVNADGVVNTADAAIILKANAELTQLDETQSKVADVTGDQMIDTKDAAKVQQYAAEMISEF